MTTHVRVLIVSAAMISAAPALHAQEISAHRHPVSAPAGPGNPADSVAADFLTRARRASERYRRIEVAIADGYRRVGMDFPTLGEHWAHIATAATGGLDPERPPVLIYVRAGGVPVLAGLAYTALLQPGQPYPSWPAGSDVWHEHNGSIEEESAPLSHALMVPSRGRVRVAVMHAWVWVENPHGVWMSDNPALPFQRLGLQVTSDSTQLMRAAHAAALLAGGAAFYAGAISRAGGLGDRGATQVVAALDRARSRAATLLNGSTSVSSGDIARLSSIWTDAIASMRTIPADSSAKYTEALATLAR